MNTTARAILTAVLVLATSACSGATAPAPPEASTSKGADRAAADRELRAAALELVAAREAALRKRDRRAFLATVDPGAKGFATTQARWFDNLGRLPATDLRLDLGDEDVMTRIHSEGDLQLPVDFTMRLQGFDGHPVTQPLIYTFVERHGRVLLKSDRNIQSDASTGWRPAPWDVTGIQVRRTPDILGVFDAETEASADAVMADLESALAAVDPVVPRWRGRFVVYDISDLQAMDKMSAMEIEDTAGVAFPVLARPGSKRTASYRFMVNPDATQDEIQRGLVFRHELVHVALGTFDDRSPTWLTEGSAEYVARSVFPLDLRQHVATERLAGVKARQLADGEDFYQVDHATNYELAALVCDYLATTRGPQSLWELMRVFRKAEIVAMVDIDTVLRREVGMTSRDLAQAALDWAAAGG